VSKRPPLRAGEPQAVGTLIETMPEQPSYVIDQKSKTEIGLGHGNCG